MAIPILFELNQELTRLFAAGSRLSIGDPRLKKIVVPLKKYGEKVPVFLKLAEQVEELISVEQGQSAQKLIETGNLLLSILSTQGDTAPFHNDTLTEICHAGNDRAASETNTGYRKLSPVITALTTTGAGRMEIVREAYEKGVFKDFRLCKTAVNALLDKYGEIADYMADVVLPSMGEMVYPFLLDGFNNKGGVIDGRRLFVLHKIKGEDMLDLVDEAVENGNAAVRAEAVKIMSDYPKYENVLLSMLGENKSVREEVMKALVKLDSKTGIDKMLTIYKGNKADTVIDALSYGTSGYLADKLLDIAIADYEEVKAILNNNTDYIDSKMTANQQAVPKQKKDSQEGDIKTVDEAVINSIHRLRSDINALKNKCTKGTIEFFKTMLLEEYLIKADEVYNKDKKRYYYKSLEDNVLETLYLTEGCNDFIWKMFHDTKENIIDKIIKTKKQKKKGVTPMLYCYAFRIGAEKLSADEFYDIFFKTHLYKEIAKYDYHVFENTFMENKNAPAFSKKIANYFMTEKINDYHVNLAARIVCADDDETLNLLAERLRNNLLKNAYAYVNYEILKCLGETKHKDFKELYELYCSKSHGNISNREELEKYLSKCEEVI